MIRVFIVDDHPVFLKGMRTLLELSGEEISIAGTAGNGREAIELISPEKVDVVLLDIRMPEMDGIAVTKELKARYPGLRVLVLTTFNERDLVAQTIEAGASGYLLKDAAEEDILASIKSVHQGALLMSPLAARALINEARSEATGRSPERTRHYDSKRNEIDRESGPVSTPAEVLAALSHREQEVLFLLIHGKENREIADELFLSDRTVRNYASKIYAAIGVKNRHSAILWAQRVGLN